MTPLLQQLRQRKLVQWALAYLAGAWLVLQVTDILGDQFGWPGVLVRGITVLLAVGFPAALILAWYHGERGQQRVSGVEVLMLAALLVLAGAAMAVVAGPGDRNAAGEDAGAENAAEGDVADPASVVVLPFADLSAQKDQEYFADGLTEEILTALTRIPGLRVPARTTSFSFKGRNIPVPEIARQLGVAHVLEGSVPRDGERLRITAQLIDARGDRHLRSERYDRQLADVFAVQEEIARSVAGALRMRLGQSAEAAQSGEAALLVAAGTTDPAVYESYLRGLHAWNRRTPESLREAIGHYRQGVERDSAFARAWAGLALTYVLIPEYADTLAAGYSRLARDAAQRALSLDPHIVEAHTALAHAHSLDWNFEASERGFLRAIEIDPTYPTARQWYAWMLFNSGKSQDAMRHFDRALELGGADRALGLLEEAFEIRDPQFRYFFPADPVLDPVRDDPRFARLVTRSRSQS